MSQEDAAVNVSEEQRRVFAGLADVLVPKAEGMPAATEVGVADKGLERVLRARPDIWPPLARLLAAASNERPKDAVSHIEADDPEGFQSLALAVTGAYYTDMTVRKLIGYPGQESRPGDPDATPEYVTNGMLDRVKSRGPIYKPTPAG